MELNQISKYEKEVRTLISALADLIKPGEIVDPAQAEAVELAIKKTKELKGDVDLAARALGKPFKERLDQIADRKKSLLAGLDDLVKKATALQNQWLQSEFDKYNEKLDEINEKFKKDYDAVTAEADGIPTTEDLIALEGEREVAIATLNKPKGIRSTQEVKILSEKDVPREFCVPDLKAIKNALLSGVDVPGATLYIKASRSGR